jgi:hypothetical protein
MQLAEEEAAAGPPIPDPEQLKFLGYDYRTRAMDKDSGRNERVARPAVPDASPDADATVSAAPTEDDTRASKSASSALSENAKKQPTSPPSLDPGVATAASSSQSVTGVSRPVDAGVSPSAASAAPPLRNDASPSPPVPLLWAGRGLNDASENAASADAAPDRQSKAARGVPVLPSPLMPLAAVPVSLLASSVPLVGHSEFVTNGRADPQKSGRDPVYALPSSASDAAALPGSPLRQQSLWRTPQRRGVADVQQPGQLPGALDDMDSPVRAVRDNDSGETSPLPAPLAVQPAWNRGDGNLPAPVMHNAAFLMHFAPAAGRLPY